MNNPDNTTDNTDNSARSSRHLNTDIIFYELLENLPFPVVVLDQDDCFVWLNHAGESFFQTSRSILVSTKLETLLAEDSHILSLIKRVRQSGQSVEERTVTFSNIKFGLKLASVQIAPFFSSQKHLADGVVIMTMQSKMIAEQFATTNQFKGAASSMAQMTSLLAHEIKNPLAGIKGAAQLIETELPPEQQELSTMIVSEVDRIDSLLERIETLSCDTPMQLVEVNIHEILDHCVKITKASFGEHLLINRYYDPSLPAIQADRDLLIQCFMNLLKNASESTSNGDSLTITTSYAMAYYLRDEENNKSVHLPLQIDIEDTGQGIADNLSAHIFEPFVSSKTKGSGLGLPLVASVIADHGGIISLQSVVKGAHFTIHLPYIHK